MNREKAPFVLTPDFEYVMGKRVSGRCLVGATFIYRCCYGYTALGNLQEVRGDSCQGVHDHTEECSHIH